MDTSERVAGKRWGAAGIQRRLDGGCGGHGRLKDGAVGGVLGGKVAVKALYQGLVDGGDVLGAGIGDGEEPCAAVSCTGLAGRVSKGDEGVDGLSHHIGLHVQNLSELALAHGRRGLHQLR